jgi:predicted RNase H-like HicB family nuclease
MAVYKYPVIIEIGKRNCSAYCPDLPGCIATGKTVEETIERMKEAVKFHIEGLKEEGLTVPKPSKGIKQEVSEKELVTGIKVAA